MPRTSKQVERTDAMILRRFPRGSHATQEGLTKLNKQLDKVTLPTFACLTALHTYRKNMWARQSDRGENDEVTAADLRRWSGMRDVWQAGTSLLCSYIIARAGQVVKGFDVNRFLALKQLQPLQLATMPPSRDRDRQFVQSEHGKHLGKFVTMRTRPEQGSRHGNSASGLAPQPRVATLVGDLCQGRLPAGNFPPHLRHSDVILERGDDGIKCFTIQSVCTELQTA